jgi:hypothetical protein
LLGISMKIKVNKFQKYFIIKMNLFMNDTTIIIDFFFNYQYYEILKFLSYYLNLSLNTHLFVFNSIFY